MALEAGESEIVLRSVEERSVLSWLREAWSTLGPGVLMAAAGIGTSHFLLAPTAGAAFGYALAWTIIVAHVVKYPAFAYCSRYTYATGRNILHGFADVAGPKGWAAWVFAGIVAVEGGVILGGVASVCASVVLAAFPAVPFGLAVVAVTGLSGILLWLGAYRGLERSAVVILLIFAGLTLLVAALAQPDLVALGAAIAVPSVPAGAVLLAGALLGYMPAPLELAVMKSIWQEESGLPEDPTSRRARLTGALFDFRVGYVISAVLGLLLLALGATLLAPRGLVPTGTAVIETISEIYNATLGAGVVPVYLLAAFLGMFVTVYAVVDGFPRGVSRALGALGRPAQRSESGREIRYWGLLYAMFVVGVLVSVFLPDPATLVGLAATGTVLLAPLWYLFIVLSVHRLPEPDRPPATTRGWAWAGLAAMTATATLVGWLNFG